jgi:hypothetical protein
MVRSFVVAALLLFAVNLWAGDPWKDKSYKDWNKSDVRKILNESPWSKRIELEGSETKHPDLDPEDTSTAGEAGGESGEEEAGRATEQENGRKRGRITFVIRWGSSKTMREAWVRGQVLQKRVLEADTERFLPPTPGDYEILLVGPDMTLFEKAIEAALKENSYLLAKTSKQRINPNRVELVRAPDGKRITGIIFHFPKKTLMSQPIFSADEKELRFISRVGAVEIEANFDLRKMVDNEGLDL